MDENRGEFLLESPADSAMIHFPYEIKHWQQQQFLPDYGPNCLSQRCYLVSLGQQGCHVCPVWTAEGNKCLRNSMIKLWTFHFGQLGRVRDGGRNGSLWP